MGLIAVLIWFMRDVLQRTNENIKKAFDSIETLTEKKDDQIRYSNDKHIELSERVIEQQERFFTQQLTQQEYLNQVLTRIEEKIDQ